MSKPIQHLKKDPILNEVISRTQLRKREESVDVYEGLVSSIVSQQLSTKAAATIKERFYALFEDHYPEPHALTKLPTEKLREIGLSYSKCDYVKNVAQYFMEHKLFSHDWSNMSDEEIIDLLTPIKGVGKWTVEMILIFRLKREDLLPLDDLVIFNAMAQLYKIEGTKKEIQQKLLKIGESWRPYRSIASLYLWSWVDNNKLK